MPTYRIVGQTISLSRKSQIFKLRGGGFSPFQPEGSLLLLCKRKDLRPVGCYSNSMLRVGRSLAVLSHHRPLVVQRQRFRRAQVQHRLDREAITRPDLFPRARPAVVWYLWCLVHRPADAVAGVIADDPVTEFLGMLLYCPADVANSAIDTRGLDSTIEAF